MRKLKPEQIEEYNILLNYVKDKKLIGICKCGIPFIKKEVMDNICDKCMEGVVVPTF